MATERIQIVVSERGSRTVRREIEDIGTGALSAERALSLLKRTLGSLGVGLALHELVQLADTYTNIQNRLKLVTTSTENLATVTAELFRISNATRSSFEGTAQVYARVALSAKDLGRSQQEILQFTESLNKAVILSGASAREAEGALIQLAQGLASNTLQGDELRSVLEQLPLVADVIAEHMGVTRGELRELGKEGKVTAQIVLDAFKEARVELDEKFAKTIPTISQSVQVLKNRFLELWGTFMTGSGVQSAIATGLLAIAEHLGTIMRVVAALAIIYAVNWIKNAIVAGTVAIAAHVRELIALEIALGATSRTAAVAGVALKGLQMLWALLPGLIFAAAVALITFSDKLALTENTTTTLQDFFVATFNVIMGKTQDAKKEVDELNKSLDDTKKKTEDAAKPTFLVDFKREIMGVGQALDMIGSETGQVVLVIHALWLGLGGAIAEAWIDGINACIKGLNSFTKGVITFINNTLGLFAGLVGGIVAAWNALPGALVAIMQRGLNRLATMTEGFLNTLIGGLNQLPFLEIASVKLGRFAEQDMPNVGAAAAQGFKDGFAAAQIFDPDALNIAELENQYAGAGERLGRALDRAMEFQFTGTQKKLQEIFAEADRVAAARQMDAQLNPAGDPRVTGEDPDEKKAKAKKKLKDAEEEARKALARFLLELDREIVLLGMSAREAERQAAIWQLEDEMKRKLTASEHALVEERLKGWQAAKDNKAIKDLVKDLENENEALKLVGQEQRVRVQLLALELELQRKLDPVEKARIENLLRQNDEMRTQNQLLQDTVGKRAEAAEQLRAMSALLNDPASGFTQEDAFGVLDNMTGGLLGDTQAGVNNQIAQYQILYEQIRAMRDQDLAHAEVYNQALAALEVKQFELRLSSASKFFGSLATLSQSKNKTLARIGKAAAATQATIDGIQAVNAALKNPPGPPYTIPMAIATGIMAAANVAKILSTPDGFMTGGSFKVPGGAGGPDSQMVSFRASPGEQVDVRTPAQVRKGTGSFGQGDGGGGAQLQARIVNILDPSLVGDYLASPEGEELFVNLMSKHSDTLRSIGAGAG